MKTTTEWTRFFGDSAFHEQLGRLYVDRTLIPYQEKRYGRAVKAYEDLFGPGEVSIFSAPGRTEIGGNHTDHQHGKVLAGSVNLDVIGIAAPTDDNRITLQSEGYLCDEINLNILEPVHGEEGSSKALIRGVAAALHDMGYAIGGFRAYTTNDVLSGSGMSSSAAFEVLVGTILSGLYNDGAVDPVSCAIAAQRAENEFFGKPSGLMDQMACSVGNMVGIDFADPANPVVHRVQADLSDFGLSLCITDTKGSHADLTPDYAAVPEEMCRVAAFFGKEVLRDVSEREVLRNIPELRASVGDRPVLRAIHFFEEEKRVDLETAALESGNRGEFLSAVKASGDSSFKYLQNVYSTHKLREQGLPLGLAVSDIVLGKEGASRVHGGGFAGTIQAFVPDNLVGAYREALDGVFGAGSCRVLKIRPVGGAEVH